MTRIRPLHALLAMNVLVLGALVWTIAEPQAQRPVQDVVRARLIELVNENGEMRAQLHVAENGAGQLRFRSGDGTIRVKFGATDEGAILLLLDRASNPAVRLASDASGPNLRLIRPDGETVVGP